MKTSKYDTDSIITQYLSKAYKSLVNVTTPPNITTRSVMIMYYKTDIDFSEEIQLNNVFDFISSVGGNLGLFIGFSFLSMLLTMAEWSQKIPIKRLYRA